MTMDADGLRRRKSKNIPAPRLIDELMTMPPSVRQRFLEVGEDPATHAVRKGLDREERQELQRLVFDRMAYSEKLQYSDRPEEIDGPSKEAWVEINDALGTKSSSLPELINELGRYRFGHRPRVGTFLWRRLHSIRIRQNWLRCLWFRPQPYRSATYVGLYQYRRWR